MNLLFIDANIYLGLYNTNKPEFKRLLGSLIELKDNIFVTKQIVDEVNCNKLNIFRQSIDNYIRQANLIPTLLPEHLDGEDSKSFSDWNKSRKKLEMLIAGSNKDLHSILNEVLLGISLSSDNISKSLHEIFSTAHVPGTHEMMKARHRKEIGNPPGKPDDPLGDQLSWEMLLNSLEKVTSLYIVSTDRDYFSEHKETLYLNPLLVEDIIHNNKSIEIKLFNKLSEALRDYNKQNQIKALPNNEELNIISEKESESLKFSEYDKNLNIPNRPQKCPKCFESDSFSQGSYLRSQYGGLTLQYICQNCSFHFDTGESFD